MTVDTDAVAAKLTASLAAHQAALQARQHRDLDVAFDQMTLAYRWRTEAHALDPQHTAPAWRNEEHKTPRGRDTHTELMTFYRQQLGVP